MNGAPTPVTWAGDLLIASPGRVLIIGFVRVGGGGERGPISLPIAEAKLLAGAITDRVAEHAAAVNRAEARS